MQESAHPEANIIFGTVIDDSLGDEVRVTVIAAGFDAGGPSRKPISGTAAPGTVAPGKAGQVNGSNGASIFDTIDAQSLPRDTNGSTVTLGGGDEDDVDVPPFMRR